MRRKSLGDKKSMNCFLLEQWEKDTDAIKMICYQTQVRPRVGRSHDDDDDL